MNRLQKSPIERVKINERLSKLTEKINTIQIPKQDSNKKYEMLDSMCEQLQSTLQQFTHFMEQKLIDIRFKSNKLAKQIKKEYSSLDNLIKLQISNVNERSLLLINQEHEAQKQSCSRLVHFMEEQISEIKNAIADQEVQRQGVVKQITQSLNSDVQHILGVLDQANMQCSQSLQGLQNKTNERVQKLSEKLKQICIEYSDNEGQFYTMLRDLVKKAKEQLKQHEGKREQTEGQILNLIDKLCEKSLGRKVV